MAPRTRVLEKRALRIHQNAQHPLYLLSLTGAELVTLATVSRISRDDTGRLIGYQRPEVRRHVNDIIEYLNTDHIIFPNSIILSFSSDVRFRRSRGPQYHDRNVDSGVLEIPLSSRANRKPAWIVDGQQRVLALSRSRRKDLAVPVNAFVADHVDIQRDQFLRINNAKPLPRGLISELLPEVASPLPGRLAPKKLPSMICELLNREKQSPFHGLIRRASSTEAEKERAVVTDTSVIRMLEDSLSTPSGCLFPYRNMATGDIDSDGIWAVLITYWKSVHRVFANDWGKPPAKSRLMHGAGIRAMGRLMDRIMAAINPRETHAQRQVETQLRLVAPHCHWTAGKWDELGDLAWNEVQNVPRHIRMLSNFLVRKHLEEQGKRA